MKEVIKDYVNTSGIYKWTSPDGKSYIGQAVDLNRRRNEFIRDPYQKIYTSVNSAIDRARKKYSDFSKWTYEVLEVCPIEKLDELEIYYIKHFNTYKNGYNCTIGGDSTKGLYPSLETRKKLSEAHKGEKSYWYGKKLPLDVRQKISKARIGKYKGKDNPHFGKTHTDEVKSKLRQIQSKPVVQFTLDGEYVAEYESCKVAAEKFGVCTACISKAALGKSETSVGYKWKFKKDI